MLLDFIPKISAYIFYPSFFNIVNRQENYAILKWNGSNKHSIDVKRTLVENNKMKHDSDRQIECNRQNLMLHHDYK